VDNSENLAGTAVPVRLVPVQQTSTDPATRIPPDGLRPRAPEREDLGAGTFPAGETRPCSLDEVPALLWGGNSGQALIGVAEPGPCTDAFGGADADGD